MFKVHRTQIYRVRPAKLSSYCIGHSQEYKSEKQLDLSSQLVKEFYNQ